MSRKAFTLIELLVVIAIIAILAAILFPVFAQAKAAAKKTAQLSNHKQTNTAYQIYIADYDDNVVLTYWPGSNAVNFASGCMRPSRPGSPDQPCTSQVPGWPKLLEPYTKNWDILHDPVVGDPFGIYSGTTFNWWFNWARFSNIGYNWVYFSPTPTSAGTNPGIQAPISATSMAEPANTIAFVDSRVNTGTASAPAWKSGYIVSDPPAGTTAGAVYWFGGWTSVSPDPRHTGGFNVGWADGHAKYNKLTQIQNDKYWDLIAD
jgi:prepilin-type N-terminal cleavage/methylation domain-containing protein/prepilin-type processing-associated H-X9-DG protein